MHLCALNAAGHVQRLSEESLQHHLGRIIIVKTYQSRDTSSGTQKPLLPSNPSLCTHTVPRLSAERAVAWGSVFGGMITAPFIAAFGSVTWCDADKHIVFMGGTTPPPSVCISSNSQLSVCLTESPLKKASVESMVGQADAPNPSVSFLPMSQPVGRPLCTVCLSIHLSVSALCGSQFVLTSPVALYFPWQSSGLSPNQWLNVLAIFNKRQGSTQKSSGNVSFSMFSLSNLLIVPFWYLKKQPLFTVSIHSPLLSSGILHILWLRLICPQAHGPSGQLSLILPFSVVPHCFFLSVSLSLGLVSAASSSLPPHPSLAAAEKLPNSSFF